MRIRSNYQKFKKHLKEKGFFYALYRGVKYFLFLIRWRKYQKELAKRSIRDGDLRVTYENGGLNLYWRQLELTKAAGLNTAVYLLDAWFDSSDAQWHINKQDSRTMILKNRWRKLPITQTWKITIYNGREIKWEINMEVEEELEIEQRKASLVISSRYNKWINSYEEGEFPVIKGWQGMVLSNLDSECVGVRGCGSNEDFRPAILFDFSDNQPKFHPQIHNSSSALNARVLSAHLIENGQSRRYPVGNFPFFSGRIILVEKEEDVDVQIESFRRLLLANLGKSIGHNKKEGRKRKKNFKVLLANPPWVKNGSWGVRAGSRWPHIKEAAEGNYLPFPFYLAYAASLLQKNGIEVRLIDCLAQQMEELPFLNELERFSPDLLLIETATASLNDDLGLLERIDKNLKVALCGPDINIRNPLFLRHNKFINYILIGEYEYTLLDLVQHLATGDDLTDVLGLIYRDKDEVKVNSTRPLIEDLDSLPWPLREQLPMDRYWDLPGDIPQPSVQMWSSRGCPFKCIFCLWPQLMYGGNHYRARDPIKLVDEMEHLVKNMGFKSVYFDDDTFNIGKQRILGICSEIKRRRLNIPWAIMARPDLMDEGILKAMKRAGLHAVKYGMESAVQELLDSSNKDMDLKKAEEMVKVTQALGIKTHLAFTFGLPQETKGTIQRTMDKAIELDPTSVQFSITTPYPGTEYFARLEKEGHLVSKNWSDYDGNFKGVIHTEQITPHDLEEARQRANRLWAEHQRKRRGLLGDIKRFMGYLHKKGLIFALKKTIDYLIYVFFIKKERYLKEIEGHSRNPLVRGILDGYRAYTGPKNVQIDLTNRCNNNCIGCWTHSPLLGQMQMGEEESKVHLSFQTLKGLIDDFYKMGVQEIQLSGAGEPFMHPDIMDILYYIKARGLRCNVVTNFTLVDEEKAKELVDLGVDLITVSLWAGTPETYLKIHPGQSNETFNRIKDALKAIHSFKLKVNRFNPQIKIYNVICNLNCNEIEQMVDFALETKVDFLELQVMDIVPGKTDSLTLNQEDRENLSRQIGGLKEREDYFDKSISTGHLRRFKSYIHRDEITEFGRFYRPKGAGFRLDRSTCRIVCPKGTRSKDEVTDNLIWVTSHIVASKCRFPQEICGKCTERFNCYKNQKQGWINIEFLNLLGIGSFLRRISSKKLQAGEYEREIVDTMPCYIGWTYSRILSNGKVIPCCKAHNLSLGNIYGQNFNYIWNSKQYNDFRYRAKHSRKDDPYFSNIDCFKSCDNVGMNIEAHHLILEASMMRKGKIFKERNQRIVILAKDFHRGNLNRGGHNFGRGIVIDDGNNFGFAEYEFYLSSPCRYSLWSRYASQEPRPVDLYLDGELICAGAMSRVTGGWDKDFLRWFKETKLNISKGLHTLKIYCRGPIPHLERIMIKREAGKAVLPAEERLYRHRSPLKLFREKASQRGLINALKVASNYIKSKKMLDDYLYISGILHGSLAFKGPFHVQIDLTNNCNNNCIGCWCNSPLLEERAMSGNEKQLTLPFALVRELIEELRGMGTKEIYYSGGGEPFMHPEFLEILEYTKRRGLVCYVNTNFTLLDEEKIKKLINLKVDHLTVSIWAGTPETYDLTHPNKTKDTFFKIRDNLKLLNLLKNEVPYVKLYNVIFNMNYHEIKEMLEFALQTNCESVEFALIDTIPGKTDRLLLSEKQAMELADICKQVKSLLDRNWRLDNQLLLFRFDQFLRRISNPKEITRATYDRNIIDSLPCYIGWLFARILPDGNVNSCLKSHRIPVGNLYRNSFKQIWNGQSQQEFRRKTLVYKKEDPFFRLIGNDPENKEAGCYKSCDDIGRNIHMHKKIMSLTWPEIKMLRLIGRAIRKRNKRRHFSSFCPSSSPDQLELFGIKDGRRAFTGPEHVVIDLTNRCNMNCIACWLYSPLLKDNDQRRQLLNQELSFEIVKRLVDELAIMGTKRVRFTGGGEPLMHPKIMELIEYVKGKGLICALTTNFAPANEAMIKKFIALKLDELAVSLWAGSEEIYLKVHPGAGGKLFQKIKDNLTFLSYLKRERPQLTLCNVITNLNYTDMENMFDLAVEVKADSIYFTVVDTIAGQTDSLLLSKEQIDTLLNGVELIKRKVATFPSNRRIKLENFEGFLRRISHKEFKDGRYDRRVINNLPCYVGWFFCRILACGSVSPCCRGVEMPMGNIVKQDFREIWHSDRYNEFRARAKYLPKSDPYFLKIGCDKTCDNLMHNEKIHERMLRL